MWWVQLQCLLSEVVMSSLEMTLEMSQIKMLCHSHTHPQIPLNWWQLHAAAAAGSYGCEVQRASEPLGDLSQHEIWLHVFLQVSAVASEAMTGYCCLYY